MLQDICDNVFQSKMVFTWVREVSEREEKN